MQLDSDTRPLCRVCAQAKEGHLTNLYDASTFVRGQPNLHTMLRAVCAPVFDKPDAPGMPSNVCAVCRNSIIAAYKLHKLCVESDRRLTEMLHVQEEPEELAVVTVKEELVVEQTKLDDPFDRSEEEGSEKDNAELKSEDPKKTQNVRVKKAHSTRRSKLLGKSKRKSKARHPCKFCPDAFRTGVGLVEHSKTAHPDVAFVCDPCKKIFFTEAELESHREMHISGKKYACDICGKRFKHSQNAKGHRTSHFGPYPCPTCGKMFNLLSSRKIHMARHAGIKRFACSLCSNRFVTKGELVQHMITHTKQRNYVCEICGSQFGKSDSLVSHVERVHASERRYACTICDLKFTCPARLKRHSLTHTGEKPHKCPFCLRGFNQTNDLVKHARNHVKGPFGCDRCDKSFRLMHELRDHYGPAHVATGEQVDELRWTSLAALERLAEKLRKEGRKVNQC